MFDEEKSEMPKFWPENVTVSRIYLNEADSDWLKMSGSTLTTSQS